MLLPLKLTRLLYFFSCNSIKNTDRRYVMEDEYSDILETIDSMIIDMGALKTRVEKLIKNVRTKGQKQEDDKVDHPPLCFYDLETTGRGKTIDIRITQIACIILYKGQQFEFNRYVDPTIKPLLTTANNEIKKEKNSVPMNKIRGKTISQSSSDDEDEDKEKEEKEDESSDEDEEEDKKREHKLYYEWLNSDLSKLSIKEGKKSNPRTIKKEEEKDIIPALEANERYKISKDLGHPAFASAGSDFIKFIKETCNGYRGNVYMLAHNGKSFDSRILIYELERNGLYLPSNIAFVDTIEVFKLALARGLSKHITKKMTLDYLYSMFTKKSFAHHNALDDCKAMITIMTVMIREDNLNIDVAKFFEQYIRPKAEFLGDVVNRVHGKG